MEIFITMLAALVEELKKTGLEAAPVDHCYAGPDDVACDLCTGRKLKALKSCLFCLAYYCEKHSKPHYEASVLKKHKLVAASTRDREKDLKVLQQEAEVINRSADKAVDDSEEIFTELIRPMEKRRSDVRLYVRSQQRTELIRVKERQERLKQEITELRRNDAVLEQLLQTEDHNQFLQNCPPLRLLRDSNSSNICSLKYFEDVTAAASEVRDKVQEVLSEKWTNISLTVTDVDVLLSQPELKTRADFLRYSREITLDPNTAHQLILSEGRRKATAMDQNRHYSGHNF